MFVLRLFFVQFQWWISRSYTLQMIGGEAVVV